MNLFQIAVVSGVAVTLFACTRSDPIGAGDRSGTPSPSRPSAVFPGFWPVTTWEAADALQRRVTEGEAEWRTDPVEVAKAFAEDRLIWVLRIEGTPEVAGSARAGWKATVRFRPLVGEDLPPRHPGPLHTLDLFGLRGATEPVWFVSALHSEDIVLDTPDPAATVTSPLRIEGRGRAYEGTILAEVTDDAGRSLNAGADRDAVLQGGATELAPFSGALSFHRPTTAGGTLALRGGAGTGPVARATIIRVVFGR